MAKHKKKRNQSVATDKEKRGKKRIPADKLAKVIGLFALSTALYYALASGGYGIVYPIYVTLGAVLIVVYFIMNKGLISTPKVEDLDGSMTSEEKKEFVEMAKRNRKRSEPILYVVLAITMTVLCDTLYAQFTVGALKDVFSGITGAIKK